MAKTRKLTNEKLNSLQNQILEIYKIPQCITDSLTTGFVLDLVNIFSTDEDWLKLSTVDQQKHVTRTLEKLEAEHTLSSRMIAVKERHFDDDEEPPRLNKRVRGYQLVR